MWGGCSRISYVRWYELDVKGTWGAWARACAWVVFECCGNEGDGAVLVLIRVMCSEDCEG